MLVGREELLARVRDRLRAHGRVLVSGPSGIGRTALLAAVAQEAEAAGRKVWRIANSRSESDTVHIGLSYLLADVPPERLEALPQPQSEALNALLRRTGAGPPDPLAMRLGTLELLRDRAKPPLLVVDDLQWLDTATAEVISFAARRLGDAMQILFSRHAGFATAGDLDRDAATLTVPPLEAGHMVELLRAHGLTGRQAGRVHAASGGNPRLALALGVAPLAREGQLPGPVAQLCREMLAGVPAPVRKLILFAAVADSATVPTLVRAGLPQAAELVSLAQIAGLANVDSAGRVVVPAALAAAAMADAADADLAKCHKALAAAAPDELSRVWHLSISARQADADLAQALAAARTIALGNGNPRRAAELGLRAVDLAPAGMAPEKVLGWLSDAATDAGVAADADLVQRALSGLESRSAPPIARARARISAFDAACQDLDSCDELLSKVLVEAAGHPDVLSAAYLRMSVRSNIAEGSTQRAASHARRAVQYATLAGDRLAEMHALTHLARYQRALGDPLSEDTLAQALALAVRPDESRIIMSPHYIAARHAFFDDRLVDARRDLLGLLPLAEAGTPEDEVELLRCLAEVEARLGRCTSALAHARRAVAITEQSGFSPGPVWHTASVVELAGGSLQRARVLADAAIQASTEEHDRLYLARSLHARGLVQLAGGEVSLAARSFQAVRELDEAQQTGDPSLLRWHGDLAEALVAIGELDEAVEVIALARPAAQTLGRIGVLAALDRAEGVWASVSGGSDATVDLLARSAEDFARLGMPLEQGRSLLALAGAQRRRRRWAASRQTVQQADALYRVNGANPWASVARQSEVSGVERAGLTEMDSRLIELVANGATNREIAQALFLSTKTVESTLTRLYRAMGVRSRVQLSTLFSASPSEDKGTL